MFMVQYNADRLESADRSPVEPYPSESPRHYVGRVGAHLIEELDEARWQACVTISFEGRKVYPESWARIADLAVEHSQDTQMLRIETLNDALLKDELLKKDVRTREEIIFSTRRAAYFYYYWPDKLEEPVIQEEIVRQEAEQDV
jgi:hypothetical protein